MTGDPALPPVVSRERWQLARDALLVREKAATRLLDELAAQRRRLPVVRVDKDYVFAGATGPVTLLDLFAGRRQLIVYHFMFAPDWPAGCVGCSRKMDDVGNLAHLHARDTSFALVSRAPYPKLAAFRQRMGWTMAWYSSGGTDFNVDMDATVDGAERFGLSVFIRDDHGSVYRGYHTTGRGLEPAGYRHMLDLTPYGRQEDWEDSPPGWPQSPTYGWGRLHDEYDD